jgi:hypothetical protein
VRWLSSEHPLGLGAEGLLAGFDLAQGPVAAGPRPTPPEIRGWLSAGGGDGGRGTAGVDLRVDSPPFLGGAYGEIEVEANVLSGEDVNDLYYVYDAGIAHPLRERWRVGGWFHHRSGHVLDASASVTSLNVLEAGIETSGWRAAEPGVDLGRAGAIDLSARAGWLLDSSFTDGVSWHARGGLRWATPPWRGARLYTLAAAERGGAEGSRYGIGALLPRGWDVRVEAGHDEQLQSADDRGIFAIATLGF